MAGRQKPTPDESVAKESGEISGSRAERGGDTRSHAPAWECPVSTLRVVAMARLGRSAARTAFPRGSVGTSHSFSLLQCPPDRVNRASRLTQAEASTWRPRRYCRYADLGLGPLRFRGISGWISTARG